MTKNKKANGAGLPRPNAEFKASDDGKAATAAEVRGMVCNPVYAGFGQFPQLVSDEMWVAAAARFVEEHGAEQFLVNLLHLLRATYAS